VYLLIYYTDVLGLAAAAVGTMFLLTRFWDAANDPIMGIIADRTHSQWGKFRPWLLWGALPFAFVGVLTFSNPGLVEEQHKLIYAYITYTMMMMAYTLINVPYASLLGVISGNSADRTQLASFRMVFAFAGSIFVFLLVDPLTRFFSGAQSGEANMAQGWVYTMMVFGSITTLLFYLTFSWTRERITPSPSQKDSLKEDFNNLLKNIPWFILLGAALSTLIFNSVRDGAAAFYFKYYFETQQVSIAGIELSLLTVYLVIGQAANIVGVILAAPISQRIGKRPTFIGAMIMASILSGLFYFMNDSQLFPILFLQCCISACAGIIFPLIWSMYADIADYSEHQSGRRATGLIFSSSSFSQKMGWTLGGACTGWLLGYYGYEANAEQTETAKNGLRMMVSFIPAVGAALSAAFMFFYTLSDKKMEEINTALSEKREHA